MAESNFTQYRRSQIAELRPYEMGEDMSAVSISAPDKDAGSPKLGDMIARNPKNHSDQWLVAAQYFADNFEPLDKTVSGSAPTPQGRALRDGLLWLDEQFTSLAREYKGYLPDPERTFASDVLSRLASIDDRLKTFRSRVDHLVSGLRGRALDAYTVEQCAKVCDIASTRLACIINERDKPFLSDCYRERSNQASFDAATIRALLPSEDSK